MEQKELAAAIVRFLNDEITSNRVGEESAESLEVAIQCLETVYGVSSQDPRSGDETSLLEIFRKNHKVLEVTDEMKTKADQFKLQGNDFLKQENYLEAVNSYSKAIETDPTNPVYFCNRAAAHAKLSQHRDSIMDCEKALQLDPKYSKAYSRLGHAYLALEYLAKAEEYFKKALDLDPENENYKSNLSLVQAKRAATEEQPGGGGVPDPMAGMGGIPNFSAFLQNPNFINMATQAMQNPAMQQMFGNLIGTLTGDQAGGTGAPPPAASADTTNPPGGGAPGLDVLLQAGQRLAAQMERTNPVCIQRLAMRCIDVSLGTQPDDSFEDRSDRKEVVMKFPMALPVSLPMGSLRSGSLLSSRSQLGARVVRYQRVLTAESAPAEEDLSKVDHYLQRSILPTMHFQASLPRLRIPKLEMTCERYLRSLEPVATADEYAESKRIVEEFQRGKGKVLQEELQRLDAANKHTSYISPMWFDMYLCDRRPLVLNHNPCLVWKPETRAEYLPPTVQATNMIIASLRFRNSLLDGLLEPEVFHLNPSKSNTPMYKRVMRFMPSLVATYASYAWKAFPLDMSQYRSLFSSTRIPLKGKDKIQRVENPKKDSTHIMVLRKGHIYIVEVIDPATNTIKSPSEILGAIEQIVQDPVGREEFPVGFLTSENRDIWAGLRQDLLDAGNQEQLGLIDSALYVITMDEEKIDQNPEKLFRTFLHGKGYDRWFDKSFSVHLTEDGVAGLNFEHAWGDGVAVMRFFNDVYSEVRQRPVVSKNTSSQPGKVKKLKFNLPDSVKVGIQEAEKKFLKETTSLSLNLFQSESLSKQFLKKQRVSPDAVMQLGFQLGYSQLTGGTAATYESCSTSAFRHGRTETMRPCTRETKAFCDAAKAGESKHTLRGMLDACSAVHNKLTKEAAMGQGFDRHLFALKHLAPENPLFSSPGYLKMNHIIISTSTLSSPAVLSGGFAPVVPDGFGIGYMVDNSYIGCVVASYPGADGKGMKDCIEDSYKKIHDIVMVQPSSSS
ncbi:unnamed protein product [Cyprideis torosa]|uniref:Uncharacterized protein n=1 Tax=Cyprideis torosa TaxID=163714 RepID=A0A7R8ZNV5_9CRUS|nr:unnamed protein product [Cyprideis torosa]CAG0892441.1 unnamed protein product [Cyprideis torosa]